jgi:hypothetical protein
MLAMPARRASHPSPTTRKGALVTLLLTECSTAGVVIAADSAITKIDAKGRIVEVDQPGWLKVLKAPKVRAAVGYWGMIGKIYGGRFDEWLKKVIEQATYSDLPSLAAALADSLNKACKHQPLADDGCAGVHVAGFHTWDDGERRPFFFHVHNGPGQFQIRHVGQPLPPPWGQNLIEVRRQWVGGPRTLFQPHQDFPSENASLDENTRTLTRRYMTRNGDFFYYSVVWEALERSFNYLNLIPNFSIPRNDTLGARRGLLHAALETTVRIYRCSNQSNIVGGKVVSVAIGQDGYLPD